LREFVMNMQFRLFTKKKCF